MKKFLEDLKMELQKKHLSSKDIDEILADHEEMIQTALNQGLSEEELNSRFGDPVALANELSDSSDRVEVEQEKNNGYQLYKTYQVNDEEISVECSIVSEDMTYQISEDDTIKIYYDGVSKINDYEISFERNVLKIAAPKQIGFLFMRNYAEDMTFIIEIPKNVAVKEFSHKGVSADLRILNLEVKNFTLSTTSGDVQLLNVKLGDTKWNTVSGDIHISQSKVERLVSSQVSGDLFIEEVEVLENMRLNTVSGDVKVENSTCKLCELSSVSGDLDGKEFYPETLSLKSVSGDLTIDNKSDKKIDVIRSSSLSGEITIKS